MNNKILLPQLISMLASATGKSKKDSETYIKGFFSVLARALEEHDTIKIKGLGTFKVNRVEPRKSVNVSTGSELEIPAHYKIVFTPAKPLAEKINKEFSWLEVVEISENINIKELEAVDDDLLLPSADLDEKEEEQSEKLGEEIEKEFGDIEPVEPFGPIDPEDPEPGEPIPEDTATEETPEEETATEETPEEETATEEISEEENEEHPPVPLIIAQEELATKEDIRGVNKHINRLKGKVNRNERNNKRRFRAVFFLILLLCIVLLGGGAFCIYKIWENERQSSEILAGGSGPENQGSGRNGNAGESATIEEPLPEVQGVVTEEPVSGLEVAPTLPSDEKGVKEEKKQETAVKETVAEKAADAPATEKKKEREDMITKSRFLITMSRDYYGNPNFWPYIYIKNASKLGRPDRIKPGTKIIIPDLEEYGVDPNNKKDINEAIMLGKEIYNNFK